MHYFICLFFCLFLSVFPDDCDGRYALPNLGVREWASHDSALKARLGPLHSDLGSDVISPSEAARRFSSTVAGYLNDHDEFKSQGEGGGRRGSSGVTDISDEAFYRAKLEKKRLQRLVFGRGRRVDQGLRAQFYHA